MALRTLRAGTQRLELKKGSLYLRLQACCNVGEICQKEILVDAHIPIGCAVIDALFLSLQLRSFALEVGRLGAYVSNCSKVECGGRSVAAAVWYFRVNPRIQRSNRVDISINFSSFTATLRTSEISLQASAGCSRACGYQVCNRFNIGS